MPRPYACPEPRGHFDEPVPEDDDEKPDPNEAIEPADTGMMTYLMDLGGRDE
jgi:hypothetical protein